MFSSNHLDETMQNDEKIVEQLEKINQTLAEHSRVLQHLTSGQGAPESEDSMLRKIEDEKFEKFTKRLFNHNLPD